MVPWFYTLRKKKRPIGTVVSGRLFLLEVGNLGLTSLGSGGLILKDSKSEPSMKENGSKLGFSGFVQFYS